MIHDSNVNSERLRKSIVAAIAGNAIDFVNYDTENLVAMFKDPIDELTEARVRLFQRAFLQSTGATLEIISSVPACLKVTFLYDIKYEFAKPLFSDYLLSDRFKSTAQDVGVGYVQFAGEIYYPSR